MKAVMKSEHKRVVPDGTLRLRELHKWDNGQSGIQQRSSITCNPAVGSSLTVVVDQCGLLHVEKELKEESPMPFLE